MPLLSTPLDDLLATRVQVAVLRTLTGETRARSGREIARSARVSHTPALAALMGFVARGIVHREDIGRTALFSIQRAHPIVSTLIDPIFAAERAWPSHLFRLLATWMQDLEHASRATIRWAGLYGSLVRGDDDAESDIDVCIVAENDEASERLREAGATRGNVLDSVRLSTVYLALPHLRHMHRTGSTLPSALMHDARTVYGTNTIDELMNDQG